MIPSTCFTGTGYRITEDADLTRRNSFRVSARAQWLVEVENASAMPEVFGFDALRRAPRLVLGEGSNVLFTRDWPGMVLTMASRGIRIVEDRGEAALVCVEAGENWNDFVHWALGHGFAGLENLAQIPGSVGAAPIQNIGAYGVEVREFIEAVEVHAFDSGAVVRLSNTDCAFAYRDSLFKREPGRYLVTAVEFVLPRTRELTLDYAGVREELAAMNIVAPTAPQVAEAVCRLRTRKLPNPAVIGNAGSFFKNPVVASSLAENMRRENPSLPVWVASDGRSKLSAAWLIETCGFKGLRDGEAGVSNQHALVLVNHGHASGTQILALAQRIQAEVSRRFGVSLEPEPIVI